MKHSERLGTERISVLLAQFSLPAIVSMLAQALYSIVDRVFIGRAVGALGIGGITVAFPFVLVLTALATP
jgi:Na+-driven multidrug efflux pump